MLQSEQSPDLQRRHLAMHTRVAIVTGASSGIGEATAIKAALAYFTDAAGVELARDRIAVVKVTPGLTTTGFEKNIRESGAGVSFDSSWPRLLCQRRFLQSASPSGSGGLYSGARACALVRCVTVSCVAGRCSDWSIGYSWRQPDAIRHLRRRPTPMSGTTYALLA